MVAPNEFWLQLHRLAEAHDAEGLNEAHRAENIVAEFQNMSQIAQRELVAELLRLTVHVPALYSLVIAEVKKDEHKKAKLYRAPRVA
jgi:stress-induced morphogen